MNNLLSYCGLVDERISASEKDLPVTKTELCKSFFINFRAWTKIEVHLLEMNVSLILSANLRRAWAWSLFFDDNFISIRDERKFFVDDKTASNSSKSAIFGGTAGTKHSFSNKSTAGGQISSPSCAATTFSSIWKFRIKLRSLYVCSFASNI